VEVSVNETAAAATHGVNMQVADTGPACTEPTVLES